MFTCRSFNVCFQLAVKELLILELVLGKWVDGKFISSGVVSIEYMVGTALASL
jgi:hypothetical protein